MVVKDIKIATPVWYWPVLNKAVQPTLTWITSEAQKLSFDEWCCKIACKDEFVRITHLQKAPFYIRDERQVEVISLIIEEVFRATEKHPTWPADVIHQSAIVAEESGELTRASLNFIYEDGDYSEIEKEAIQVAASAFRLIWYFDPTDR